MSTPLERFAEQKAGKLHKIRYAVQVAVDVRRDDLLAELIFKLEERIENLESRLEQDPDE